MSSMQGYNEWDKVRKECGYAWTKSSVLDKPASYEYDFGTATELKLKVISEQQASAKGSTIPVLARNVPPVILCEECGKPATEVCSQCIFEGRGWLCDDCVVEHECEKEMLLPVVNSPRVGMCAYTG